MFCESDSCDSFGIDFITGRLDFLSNYNLLFEVIDLVKKIVFRFVLFRYGLLNVRG